MRVGVLSRGLDELSWVEKLGFKSTGWLRFFQSPAADPQADWKSYVDKYKDEAGSRGIRVSAIGALYKNPLDPKQTDYSRDVFKRAILVASRMGVKTVCGFPGAVIRWLSSRSNWLWHMSGRWGRQISLSGNDTTVCRRSFGGQFHVVITGRG